MTNLSIHLFAYKDAPQLNLKLGSATLSLQSIQEGNDIYFDVDIDSNPISSKPITWRFNGDVLQSQTGKFVFSKKSNCATDAV